MELDPVATVIGHLPKRAPFVASVVDGHGKASRLNHATEPLIVMRVKEGSVGVFQFSAGTHITATSNHATTKLSVPILPQGTAQ